MNNPTPGERLTEAMEGALRLRERFTASLTPQQRAWHMELEDADIDQRIWQSDMLLEELIRHLAPPWPVLRLLYGHLVSQTFDAIGTCCRSPEEEDSEREAEHGRQ